MLYRCISMTGQTDLCPGTCQRTHTQNVWQLHVSQARKRRKQFAIDDAVEAMQEMRPMRDQPGGRCGFLSLGREERQLLAL